MNAQELKPGPASAPTGLSEREVAERRERWGYNELPETKQNPLVKFLSYYTGRHAHFAVGDNGRGCAQARS